MKFEHFINDEDREMIEGFIKELEDNPNSKEDDFIERGGLGVQIENIDSKTGEILFSVYKNLAYVTRKNKFSKKQKLSSISSDKSEVLN